VTKDEKEIAEGIMKFTMEIAELRAYNAERLREAIAWHRSHPAPTVGWTPASKWKDSPMTDTPERALLRRLVADFDHWAEAVEGLMGRTMDQDKNWPALADARALLSAPPASEGEVYRVQARWDNAPRGAIVVLDASAYKRGDRVTVRKVDK